jgi:4a-hydroxytetrahydrobiopterin dehydratase
MTEQCEACHAGMPLLSNEEIKQALEALPGWHYEEETASITKSFQFKGFYKTMAFVNAVAWIAQQQKHHPDMQVSYNHVSIHFQTHVGGGVSENDPLCARLVNALLEDG